MSSPTFAFHKEWGLGLGGIAILVASGPIFILIIELLRLFVIGASTVEAIQSISFSWFEMIFFPLHNVQRQ